MDKRKQYRIVLAQDLFWKYRVQVKHWWFPVWFDCNSVQGCASGFDDLDRAERFANKHALGKRNVIKELGRLP